MEPRIQYAKTSDGVSIAYSVMGEGPPLVVLPNLSASHLQAGFDMPGVRSFCARLADRLKIILYDCRGMGMSQRDAIDFSAEAAERDLEAVVDRLSLDRFALYGHIVAGDAPFSYAAHHPGRVSGLVYWVGQTVLSSPEIARRLAIMDSFMDEEWDLYVDLRSAVMFGLDSPRTKPFATLMRVSHTPASFRQAVELVRRRPNAAWYSAVRAPTLIAHLAGVQGPTDVARTLASGMPSAHVIAIPGTPETLMPYVYDNEVLTTAIADFVQATWSNPTAPVHPPELQLNAMRAILWTDLERHSEMMEQLGDEKGRDVLREHERITREALAAHGGTEVKAMGDGFMAWFSSAQQALDSAIALQRSIAAHNAAVGAHGHAPLRVRVGVNAGEPIVEEDDLFGSSVIAAARICREASGDEIVVSDVVRQLVAGKNFLFAERGAVALRGFEEPIRLFEVRWREE